MKINKQRQSLICSENYEMNDFLTILELCTFYIDYKNVKFKAINFSGRTSVKYFRQAKLLQFCKDTAKVSSPSLLKKTAKPTHSLPCKEEDTNTMDRTSNKWKYKRSWDLTSKHRMVKKIANCKNTAWKVSKYGVFFWSVFSRIRTRKKPVLGHF